MIRALALIGVFTLPVVARAQDRPAGEPALIEQFDGKKLQGWEIDGESKIESGALVIGGKAEARLRLKEALGTGFKVNLEYKYAGPAPFSWQFEAGQPPNRNFFHDAPTWTEVVMTRQDAGALFALPVKYVLRELNGPLTGRGSLSARAGRLPTMELIVPAGATLTIRRIALATTPPGEGDGRWWIPLTILALILAGVVGVGWFLKRRARHRRLPPGHNP